MKNLEIYIDRTRLNFITREGFPLSLNYSIESAENPAQLNGSHSKRSATFPSDGETGEFFQEWANVSRVNPDAPVQKPVRVDVNGVTVLSGTAQLDETVAANGRSGRIGGENKVGIFGNNAAWFEAMQGRLIREYGMIPVHDLTAEYIADSLAPRDNANPDTDTFGYFLPRTLDWSLPFNTRYVEMHPFIFIRPLLIEAFRQAGYIFQSDFFDTDLGKRLMLPCLLRPYSEEDLQQWFLMVLDSANGTSVSAAGNPNHITVSGAVINMNAGGNYDYGTGVYTAPMSGYYIMATPSAFSFNSFRVRINGGTPEPQFTDPYGAIGVQGRVFLNQGDEVDLVMVATTTTTIGLAFLLIQPDFNNFEAEFTQGTTVDFSKYGNPDWKITDCILGLTHAFGLVWDTDVDAQTVTVEPRDRYYIESQTTEEREFFEGFYRIAERDDLTQRIDLSKDGAVTSMNSEREKLTLAWKTDSNDANQSDLEDRALTRLYDGTYTYPTGRFQKGETRSENPFFCKTVHVLDRSIMNEASEIVPQLPLFQAESFGTEQPSGGERKDFGPRLLYFAGRRGGIDGLVNLEDYAAYDFPAAFQVNYNDGNGTDPSLSFGDEDLLNIERVPGLMWRLHLQRIKRLEVGKMLTEWIRWSELDILNLDFRAKVLLGDTLYLLQKINGYKPLGDGSTETELLADAIPDRDDVDKLSRSNLIGYFTQTS